MCKQRRRCVQSYLFHRFALRLVARHGVRRAQTKLPALYEPPVTRDLPLEHDARDVVHTLERLVAVCEAGALVHGRLDHAHAARAHTIYDHACPALEVGVEVAHHHAHGAFPELQRVRRAANLVQRLQELEQGFYAVQLVLLVLVLHHGHPCAGGFGSARPRS